MNPRTWLAALGALTLASTGWLVVQAQEPPHTPPRAEAAFTSTRQINALHVTPAGELWAATGGGVLRRDPGGAWHRYTRIEGLPAHEALGFAQGDVVSGVTMRFPTTRMTFRDGAWTPSHMSVAPGEGALPSAAGPADAESTPSPARPSRAPGDLARVTWRGEEWLATASGLVRVQGHARHPIGMPPGSLGTHPTALCPTGDRLLVAIYGDTVYAWDGQSWRKELSPLPEAAREITALARSGTSLWLGTRREGIWEHTGGVWTHHLQPAEPYDHNVQALGVYRGNLYVSTLEDGLMVRRSAGWTRLGPPLLSSPAPRHLLPFRGALYVRHGTGQVDRLDRERWSTHVFRTLPRKQVFALAADARRLYAAQWGGWSEWDGKAWTHFLDLPALQGLPVTALQPDGDTLWLGTQGRGLAEVSRTARTVRWHDERSGLTDDWITALCRSGRTIYAGTFVGGLSKFNGKSWTPIPGLAGENVTALAAEDEQSLLITTRSGLWRLREARLTRLNDQVRFLDPEMQAVLPVTGGLWAGARTALFYLPAPPP